MNNPCRLLLAISVLSLAQNAWADNLSSGSAYSIAIGGPAAEATVNATGPVNRWYRTGYLQSGRSYCAQAQAGVFFDTSASAGFTDTAVTVYRADGTTVIDQNDDALTVEPGSYLLSRVCFVASASEAAFIKVSSLFGSFNVRVSMVETTLFSNWFYLGGDYGAFTLIRNTTNAPVGYTINWRDATGSVVASTSATLFSNGSAAVNARAFPGAVATVSGAVEIAHNGSAGAIVATTTVLSGTTGLSFDTIFATRPTW